MGHLTLYVLDLKICHALKSQLRNVSTEVELCADGVVVIAISLFSEVPGSIPERGKKRRFLRTSLFVHAVHFLSILGHSYPQDGDVY